MKAGELVPHMRRHFCLTESEVRVRLYDVVVTIMCVCVCVCVCVSPCSSLLQGDEIVSILNEHEQVSALLDSLLLRGSYGIGSLYLSLRESSDEMYGTPTHYQLAFELKNISEQV